MRNAWIVVVAVVALLPAGCSFYYSSESSAKSITSSSESSSDDDDDDEKKEAYRNDVRDFTAAYAAESADPAAFASGLSAVARRHGITDWEAEDATFTAIGAGPKRANVAASDVARYESALAGSDRERIRLLRDAWAS